MKLSLKARIVLANSLTESQIERGPFIAANTPFDNTNGMGSVSDCANVVYAGAVALMRPRHFLNIATPAKEIEKIESIKRGMAEGQALGSPFLKFDDRDFAETGTLRCSGHEGRHRCWAMLETTNPTDDPIPVCIFISYAKARNFTPEILVSFNRGVQCQDSTRIASTMFEGLWLDNRFYTKAELG